MKRALDYVLDWIVSIPLLIGIGLLVLVNDPLLRLARLFGIRPAERVMMTCQLAIVGWFRVLGFRIEVEVAPGVDQSRPYIVIANHQCNFDIPLISSTLPATHPKFVSTKDLGRFVPSVSFALRRLEHALVDPQGSRESLEAVIRMGRQARKRKVSATIFPEGGRARDGRLRPFRSAGTKALLRAYPDAPVLPVTIDGGWHLMRHGLFPAPRRATVRIRLGPIVDRSAGDAEAILAAARASIEETISGWRSAGATPDPVKTAAR